MTSSDERRPSGLASAAKKFAFPSSSTRELPSGHVEITQGSWDHVTKLKVGNVILVHGMPLIGGLEGGKKYKVLEIREAKGGWFYVMLKFRAKMEQWFKITAIDDHINVKHMGNKIEIVK